MTLLKLDRGNRGRLNFMWPLDLTEESEWFPFSSWYLRVGTKAEKKNWAYMERDCTACLLFSTSVKGTESFPS